MEAKEFVKRFLRTEIAGLGVGMPIAAAYAIILTDMPPEKLPLVLLMVAVLTVLIVLFVGMPLNFIIIKKTSALLKKDSLDRNEKIRLFQGMHRIPVHHGIAIFSRIAAGAVVAGFFMVYEIGIDPFQSAMAVLLAMYGSYIAGILAYTLALKLVRPLMEDLESEIGFTDDDLGAKKYFGMSYFKNNIFFVIIPVIFTTITVYLAVESALNSDLAVSILRAKILGVIFINLATNIYLGLLVIKSYRNILFRISENLKIIASNSGNLNMTTRTTIKDEMEYIIYLLNVSFRNLSEMIEKVKLSNTTISDASLSLSAMSEEMAATSNEQAAAVKEIVATMEDSTKLTEEIAEEINEIDTKSSEIEKEVDTGVALIGENKKQMEMITEADKETVEVIEKLNDRISSIWEIVNLINNIANQTKIIAFNAELEATAAGEAGRNFQIVATEIRRLADNTVSSTAKIKESISDIQSSSETLSQSSKNGTIRIKEGINTTEKLTTLMVGLKETAQSTNSFAGKISGRTGQQVSGFKQIFSTLKMISTGIGQFAESTDQIARNTGDLKQMVGELEDSINTFHYK